MKRTACVAVLVVFLFAGCNHSMAETAINFNPLTPLPELQKLADSGLTAPKKIAYNEDY